MTPNPYERFQGSELILRDELAMDRTILANERTLLSYIRTALAFAITGAGIIKFFESIGWLVSLILGWIMVTLGALILVVGIWRYRRVARHIAGARRPPESSARPPASSRPA